MAKRTISILGCGYLGFPLAIALSERGWHVKGSTTTPEKMRLLEKAGIEPHLLRLDPEFDGNPTRFLETDTLFLNIPPGRRRTHVETFYGALIAAVLHAVCRSSVRFVVFASSTSVYPAQDRVWKEEEAGISPPWRASGRALLEAERQLQSEPSLDATILRFAGLYGYERAPGRFVGGILSRPRNVVNVIHRDDAVGAVLAVLTHDARGETFNVCSDGHPTRAEFYARAAEWLGADPPTVEDGSVRQSGLVSNRRLKERLGYAMVWPDPLRPAP